MQVRMVAKDISMTASMRDYIERRLRFAFSPMMEKSMEVAVRLSDLNGPRGGCDMLCQVSVDLPGKQKIVIKEVQDNMYNAIDIAIKKAAYYVMQILVRRRQASRKPANQGFQADVPLESPALPMHDGRTLQGAAVMGRA